MSSPTTPPNARRPPIIAAASDDSQSPIMSSPRIMFAMSAAIIPLILFRVFTPFSIYVAQEIGHGWTWEEAVFFDTADNWGILTSSLSLFIFKHYKMPRLMVSLCTLMIVCILLTDVTPRHGLLFGLLFFFRFVFGWALASLGYGILLSVSEFGMSSDGSGRNFSQICLEIVLVLSSGGFVLAGFLMEKWASYRMVFLVCGIAQLPFILILLFSIPNVFYEDYADEDEGRFASSNFCYNYCGIVYEMKLVFFGTRQSTFLNLSIMLLSFCFNLYLTGIGMYYYTNLNFTAYQTGQLLTPLLVGAFIAFALTRGWSYWAIGPLGLVLLGGSIMLIGCTIATVFADEFDVYLSSIVTLCLGVAFQFIFSQVFYLSVEFFNGVREDMDMICVLTLLVSVNLGGVIGEVSGPILWESGGWANVSLTVAVFAVVGNLCLLFMVCPLPSGGVGVLPSGRHRGGLVEDDDEEYLLDDPEQW